MDINISTKHLLRKMLSKDDVAKYPVLKYSNNIKHTEEICTMLKNVLNKGEDDFVFRTYAHKIELEQLKLLLELKDKGQDYTRCCNYGILSKSEVDNYLYHLQNGVPNTRWLYEVGRKLSKEVINDYLKYRDEIGEILDEAIRNHTYIPEAFSTYIYFAHKLNTSSIDMLDAITEIYEQLPISNYLWILFDMETPHTPEHFIEKLKPYKLTDDKSNETPISLTNDIVYLKLLMESYPNLLDWDICRYFVYVKINLRYRKLENYCMELIQIIERLLDSGVRVTKSMVTTLGTSLAPLLRLPQYLELFNQNESIAIYFNLGLSDEELFNTFTDLTKGEVKDKPLKETWLDRFKAYNGKFID